MNELRNPHDPVIPGEHVHPPEGHGGVSMPIGVSGVPDGMMLVPIPQVLIESPKLDEQLAEEEAKTKDSDDDGNEAS